VPYHDPDVVQFDGQKAKEQEEHHKKESIRLEMLGKAGKHNPRNQGRKDDQEQNNIVHAEHSGTLDVTVKGFEGSRPSGIFDRIQGL